MFQNLITRCSSVGYMTHSISCRNRKVLWNARIIMWICDDWKRTGKENTAAYFKVSPTEYSGLLTYSLTYSMELSPSWELTGFQLSKKFSTFYGTRWFITAFTSAHHLSLSWASSIQSIPPHPISWRSILILSSRLRLGLPSGLTPSGFPTKTQHTPFLFPTRATCPAHLFLLKFITRKNSLD